MKRRVTQLFLSVLGQGRLGLRLMALGLVLAIAVQSLPLRAFAATPSDAVTTHHAAAMSDGQMAHHQMLGHETSAPAMPSLTADHSDHQFSGCSGTVCCAGSCFDFAVLRETRRVIPAPFAPDAAKTAPSLAPVMLERPPRLTA
ncbi:hypothetical protein [Rhodobacter aestuarii]|uniref:hypothetical protein n=1 Tax=Rhodobacter aestuarii TaxID=453582 RepID=UPI001115630F|nr:hypothetical protein [Rhodobacter aestuarii]